MFGTKKWYGTKSGLYSTKSWPRKQRFEVIPALGFQSSVVVILFLICLLVSNREEKNSCWELILGYQAWTRVSSFMLFSSLFYCALIINCFAWIKACFELHIKLIWVGLLDLVDTTLEEFQNGVFTLKTHQMFTTHTTSEKLENTAITGHYGFVFEENSGRGVTWLSSVTPSFSESSDIKLSSVRTKTKSRCFRDGMV